MCLKEILSYCKIGNIREGFIFAKEFREKKPSRNGEIILLFTDGGE